MERGRPLPPLPPSPQKMGRGLHYCSYTGTCIYCYSFNCFHQSTDCTNSVRLQNSVIVTYNKWRNWLFFQYENCTSTFSIYKDNFRNWRTIYIAIIAGSLRFDTIYVVFLGFFFGGGLCLLPSYYYEPIKQTVIYLCKSIVRYTDNYMYITSKHTPTCKLY